MRMFYPGFVWDNFATSATLVEVCALLNVVLDSFVISTVIRSSRGLGVGPGFISQLSSPVDWKKPLGQPRITCMKMVRKWPWLSHAHVSTWLTANRSEGCCQLVAPQTHRRRRERGHLHESLWASACAPGWSCFRALEKPHFTCGRV